MRRFSQRTHLVTLSEINITPLLDLAFVLLIIFVITTPLLDKGQELHLPKASGGSTKQPDKKDVKTVEIDPKGVYWMSSRAMRLDALVAQLAQDYKYNPNLVIYVRADENSKMKDFVALTDACQQSGISRFSIRTAPAKRP
jgi:biopolymer transport protein ExbD/biopolymer transport protein TolR